MEIGAAIKTLRSKKGLSQKDLAVKMGISTNALCQIEKNNSFPQKSTIAKICEIFNIPSSYLLLLSINDADIPIEKKQMFNTISNALKEMIVQEV
ncbi:helix-turn-helix domain-containing protein [Emticicia fontis]